MTIFDYPARSLAIMQAAFTDERHGLLMFEFIEWAIDTPRRKLANQVWALMSGELVDSPRIFVIGSIFTKSTSREDLERMLGYYVGQEWPKMDYQLPIVQQVNAMPADAAEQIAPSEWTAGI
ncbi:MAG TPA: hypothetical protein VF077_00570 [Nitrospiraceae bacterium]